MNQTRLSSIESQPKKVVLVVVFVVVVVVVVVIFVVFVVGLVVVAVVVVVWSKLGKKISDILLLSLF